jgi:hypothetical protein
LRGPARLRKPSAHAPGDLRPIRPHSQR